MDKKNAMIVGGRVTDGQVLRDSLVRIKRKGEYVGEGKIVAVKVGQEDMAEVQTGTECGLRYEGRDKIEEGDMLEIYREETKVKKLVFEK